MKKYFRKLASLCLFMGLLAGCDGSSFLAFFQKEESGVLARVNGDAVKLSEVEAIYDIRNTDRLTEASMTLAELHADYAEIVWLRIRQLLVRQYLAEKGISVNSNDVLHLEKKFRDEYSSMPEGDFDQYLEARGIKRDVWRDQVLARLEEERLQRELGKSVALDGGEIAEYVHAHADLGTVPERWEVYVLHAPKKKDLEKFIQQKKDESRSQSFTLEKNPDVSVQFFRLSAPVPEIADLQGLSWQNVPEKSFSALEEKNGEFWSVFMMEHLLPEIPSSPALFALAERELFLEKMPELMEEWLSDRLNKSSIQVTAQFFPENVPVPVLPVEEEEISMDEMQNSYGTL